MIDKNNSFPASPLMGSMDWLIRDVSASRALRKVQQLAPKLRVQHAQMWSSQDILCTPSTPNSDPFVPWKSSELGYLDEDIKVITDEDSSSSISPEGLMDSMNWLIQDVSASGTTSTPDNDPFVPWKSGA
ncbi:hypothetical protein RSOLAG1IB_12094 [Rhizoctonia solani AG-1 IB]|uniref:Uncharacterized protein n=1 Tax=Thanatephorus cucumeris (strain AG1-IB / isolate 7/3/14) TaxID=1108050 RepID=M5C2M4_THACB|nr:hypothetical protein BN14_07746 [Rhizoctonia solani AG-1 IB]CEL57214.1 hypothetical protein RSOLAG1IB_12094 [Rhizoctonia solani AG-1 IB]